MKEYSDLDLNKMIAELENWDFDFSLPKCMFFEWKYLGPLMVKYKVDLVHGKSLSTARIYDDPEDNPVASLDFYHEEVSYGKAIIMCILKSKNII